MITPAYEHNGEPCTREAFYAIACDPRRSVAVEACAGAGKTWMLVSRIVRALIEPGADGQVAAPHEILAITFTRKAAGEMRRRLADELQRLALIEEEAALDAELIARGVAPQRAAGLRAPLRAAYRTLLESGRPVQVRTFHSWFGALLAEAPLKLLRELGLPPAYELLLEDERARAEVWRPFLAGVANDPALHADYRALVTAHGRNQTDKALQSALAKRAEFMLADAAGAVADAVPPFGQLFPELAGFNAPCDALFEHAPTAALLAEAAAGLSQAAARTFQEKGDELRIALDAHDAPGVRAALLTQADQPRKFSDKVPQIEVVRAAQHALLGILDADAQHAAWQHQQRLARLARALLAAFADLKRARGWVDMADLERAAQLLLTDELLSGWVQQRLDARLRHLLIDEFQDTSPVQWQALREWLSGYAGAGAGAAMAVFLVGDPKQSIYRFRRAEPQVFAAAQRFVREALGGERLACDHTRRNAPGIVAVVNAALGEAQDAGEYAGFRTHTTESDDPGGALLALPPIPVADGAGERVDPLAWRDTLTVPRVEAEETRRAREAEQAARWVQGRIDAGVAPRQLMVLARKNEPLTHMQAALRALGVATDMPEKAALPEVPAVQDLIALIDALVSPAHDLSLARALKSPIFGASDAELTRIALAARAQPGMPWFELLQDPGLDAQLACRPAADLRRYRHWVATLPPHDALQAIYGHADVRARFAAAVPAPERERTLAQLDALLGAALELQGGRYLSAYALVRAFRSKWVAPSIRAPQAGGGQAVRLLTVHGAKGLEADEVLLLDTQAAAPRAATMGALIDWPGEAPAPQQFVFLTHESRPPPSARELLAREQAERAREELNALYVALTRARRTLVLSSITPGRNSSARTWWDRLHAAATPIEAPPSTPLADTAAPPPARLLEVPDRLAVVGEPAGPPPMEPGLVESPADSDSSRVGQAMHWLLERVAPSAGADVVHDWPAPECAAAARRFMLDEAQLAQARTIAQRILAGAGGWAWRSSEVLQAFNEVALVHEGEQLRIDRLVLRRGSGGAPDAWWVLDYKSALRPERDPLLLVQLARYRDAVGRAHPQRVVRAAFLSADGRLLEID